MKLLLDTHTFVWWDREALPAHHRDPFDRLLVAQAVVEGAVLVSADPVLKSYSVDFRW